CHVASVQSDGVYRLRAADSTDRLDQATYLMRLERRTFAPGRLMQYWIHYRTDVFEGGSPPGIHLFWTIAGASNSPGLLLDTTPGTPDRQRDSALLLGRTFSDPVARLHITPIAHGTDPSGAWIDVQVNHGPFPG